MYRFSDSNKHRITGMIRGKKIFTNELLFPHSQENVRDLLHKVINNWMHAHNKIIFFFYGKGMLDYMADSDMLRTMHTSSHA